MKVIVQNYRQGSLGVEEIPMPRARPGFILVQNRSSLISLGTERSVLEFGRKSLLGKILARPELMRRAIKKAQRDGYWKVFLEGQERLDQTRALGYSSAGVVVAVGEGVEGFAVGDPVACIGQDFASHAEYVSLPRRLCAKIPDGVGFDEAAFGMVASIALHGIHEAEVRPGDRVAIIGLGLIGLLAVQILKSYGCEVGVDDVDEEKVGRALGYGVSRAGDCPSGFYDRVVVCATTSNNQPLLKAVELVRAQGAIVLVGVADISFDRQSLWEKEVKFSVSRGGGFGFGDPVYEFEGIDYPREHVPYTQERNLAEILRLIKTGSLRVSDLITHRFSFSQALEAYGLIDGASMASSTRPIGVILEYPSVEFKLQQSVHLPQIKNYEKNGFSMALGRQEVRLGVIGGGLFTRSVLLPASAKVEGLRFVAIATAGGLSAKHLAKKYNFSRATTDYQEVLNSPDIDAVIITTRHGLHAKMVIEALGVGKWVFVEKPLAIAPDDLELVVKAAQEFGPRVMVGYNRRYSKLAKILAQTVRKSPAPILARFDIHAGPLPAGHWVYDLKEGGGRILSEVCHFVDLAQYLIGQPIRHVSARSLSRPHEHVEDQIKTSLLFDGGSLVDISYLSWDSPGFREKYQVCGPGFHLTMEDFRSLSGICGGRSVRERLWTQDAGYFGELNYFIDRVREGKTFDQEISQYAQGLKACFEMKQSLVMAT
ncbi:MAG: bi-domain-containing oxidoreductase [Elusimicrobia bacterium]|nr:bi-domain-containing oxidoreductase [Elusimicrobiota bacterium]